jgi:hypothetical protein
LGSRSGKSGRHPAARTSSATRRAPYRRFIRGAPHAPKGGTR